MTIKERVILILGSIGFCSQIGIQFTGIIIPTLGIAPSPLIMGASLALLGVAPFLRLDEVRRRERDQEPDQEPDQGQGSGR